MPGSGLALITAGPADRALRQAGRRQQRHQQRQNGAGARRPAGAHRGRPIRPPPHLPAALSSARAPLRMFLMP